MNEDETGEDETCEERKKEHDRMGGKVSVAAASRDAQGSAHVCLPA